MAYGIVLKRARNNPTRLKTQSRSMDSADSRMEVKPKISISQCYEKYMTLAREAMSGGDRVMAESYYQHAEHYLRIINESRAIKIDTPLNVSEAFDSEFEAFEEDDAALPFFLRPELEPEPDFEEILKPQ